MLIFKIKPSRKLSKIVKASFPVGLLPIAITPLYSFTQKEYSISEVTNLGEDFLGKILNTLVPYQKKIEAFFSAKEEGMGLSFFLEYLYLDNDGEDDDKDRYFSMEVEQAIDKDFFSSFTLINDNKKMIYGSSSKVVHDYFFSISDIFSFREALQKENDALREERFIDIDTNYFKETYLTKAEKMLSSSTLQD